ncbi:MAG TPA: hypothetical protein VJB66_03600, partial [Candidatus Nanoarchaeia archaeon]|nr:hypothetical protein [Candidatus Nanoarchaeia archaeon]
MSSSSFGCRRYALLFFILILFVVFSVGVSAHAGHNNTRTGNVTIQDRSINSSSKFNFSSRVVGSTGHIEFYNTTAGASIKAIGGAELRYLGSLGALNRLNLFTEFPAVPNRTQVDPGVRAKYMASEGFYIYAGDFVSFWMPDNTYALMLVTAVSPNYNITFEYISHNQSANYSFFNRTGCYVHLTETACFADRALDCYWGQGLCRQGSSSQEHDFVGCGMLPKLACNSIDQAVCLWNSTRGTKGLCVEGAGFNSEVGFVCGNITNGTFCANQAFTEGTGLCTANNTNSSHCLVNRSKTFNDVPNSPVFSCEASGYIYNQTKCDSLSVAYYMPCNWNNVTNKCEFAFFDFGKFSNFEDITSDDTCKMMGGFWKEESAWDPITLQLQSEKWCEPGFAPVTSDKSGAGKFFGNADSISDCSKDCFACEFNSSATPPVPWANSTAARTQCENSGAGCQFRQDSNAFNGLGWCEPVGGLQGFDCNSACGDCTKKPNAQSACLNSTLGCRWDNSSISCVGLGAKTCSQDCFQCAGETSCSISFANGGCRWDDASSVCKPKAGSFEICFDGLDNDNNGQTDCADFKCSSDGFCGGESSDANNCFQYGDIFKYGALAPQKCQNATGCLWINDSFGFESCVPQSEICWRNNSFSSDSVTCNAYGGGNVCHFVPVGSCEENSSLFTSCSGPSNITTCNAVAGCKWSSIFNTCDVATIVECEHNSTRQINQTQCTNADCIWQGGSFGGTFEGSQGQNCISPCIDSAITLQTSCVIAERSTFYNGTCVWNTGRCEPKQFVGKCAEFDGDISECTANSACKWVETKYGGTLRYPNGSVTFSDYIQTGEVWMAMGVRRPGLLSNVTRYAVNKTGTSAYLELMLTGINSTVEASNISRIVCNGTVVAEYNLTTRNCEIGQCNV